MDGEWLHLLLRWLHVAAAMAWIGTSFFFHWLDEAVEPPRTPRPATTGELWMVHSGGFYRIERLDGAPDGLPAPLHGVRWEAAWTWASGALLLVLVYHLSGDVFVRDPWAPLGPGVIALVGAATLALGWLVYDGLWRSPLGRTPGRAALVSYLLLVGVGAALAEIFTGRWVYMHVGALLGTLMTANVWLHILPAQRRVVAALAAGHTPDPTLVAGAKQRSRHNNYMTLPVVLLMLSAHAPWTYGHAHAASALAVLVLVGAGARHALNLQARGAAGAALAVGIASTAAFAALVLALA